jgi:hypothetical protein
MTLHSLLDQLFALVHVLHPKVAPQLGAPREHGANVFSRHIVPAPKPPGPVAVEGNEQMDSDLPGVMNPPGEKGESAIHLL